MTVELTVELIGLAVANVATIIGVFSKLNSRVTRIETQQEFLVSAFKHQYGISTGEIPKVTKK